MSIDTAVDVEAAVRRLVSDVSGLPSNADARADLYLDLGVASIHALQLLTELEDQFGISIPDDEFVEATSIAKLTVLMTNLRK